MNKSVYDITKIAIEMVNSAFEDKAEEMLDVFEKRFVEREHDKKIINYILDSAKEGKDGVIIHLCGNKQTYGIFTEKESEEYIKENTAIGLFEATKSQKAKYSNILKNENHGKVSISYFEFVCNRVRVMFHGKHGCAVKFDKEDYTSFSWGYDTYWGTSIFYIFWEPKRVLKNGIINKDNWKYIFMVPKFFDDLPNNNYSPLFFLLLIIISFISATLKSFLVFFSLLLLICSPYLIYFVYICIKSLILRYTNE